MIPPLDQEYKDTRISLAIWEFVTLPWYKKLWYWMVSI